MITLLKNRSLRTILLAIFAALTFVCSAIFVFDVDPYLMLKLFVAWLICTVVLILIAFCFTALRLWVKHRLKRP